MQLILGIVSDSRFYFVVINRNEFLLISYGPNIPDLTRHAATFVVKVLNGAKPANLPIEQPTKFELAINLKTARTLDLTVPHSLLSRADELIDS
jgi:putative tryptophan/tyrosine transport system substrate-binding protein